MKSKKVLITGIAGFIGFHLAQALQARGDTVVGIDNFNLYYDVSLKHKRALFLAEKNVLVQQGDIVDQNFLNKFFTDHSVTHIVHLAAQAGVRYSLENPHTYIRTNIEGFLNILELCRLYPATPLLYASSSSVYGLNSKIPFAVEDSTDRQASLYGVSKKTNELMAQTYHHLFGLLVTGLRFFTVYGPWGRPDMAYFSFTKAIIEEQPLPIYNNGQMYRDFTYIDDIVEGILLALDLASTHSLFNLGNHQPVSLLYFIECLEKELGKKAQKVFMPMQAGDVVSTYADIAESEKILRFKPKVNIEEGIYRFVEWYKKYYKNV